MSLDTLDAVLPPAIGVFPHLCLTGRYVLSQRENDAPGHSDEYAGHGLKAVALPDGRVAAAVADAGSRGAAAAIATARLLAVLRGHLESGASLDAAVAAVDRYAERSPFSSGATMAAVILSPGDGSVEVASAGHALPLHLSSGGGSHPLALGPSRPLGLGGTASRGTLTLACGDAVMLHTDGLVTAQNGSVLDGALALREVIAGLGLGGATGPAFGDALCEGVLAAMQRPHGYRDDVALLVVQRVPNPQPLKVSSVAAGAPSTQAVALFAAWLDGFGVSLLDHVSLSGATAEMIGVLSLMSSVTVSAELTDDAQVEVTLEVDRRWQPESDLQRRALVVAGGLVTSLTLRHRDQTTQVILRQPVGRTVPLLQSGSADRRTGVAVARRPPSEPMRADEITGGVRLSGSLGPDEEAVFHDLVHETTCAGTRSAVVDLTRVDRLCGPAVRLLFQYAERTRACDANLTVVAARGSAADQVLTRAALPHRWE
ncbi:PP2C family protein-serine/threonine phosphatase [Nocardioides sp.]|uniref:SpoIIE family protein phosphatase n=1 Tax=Nocardioides sp. TaxID=35761 RepID=UPI002601AB78|nr:PP2C family protein-serine/threonine phosphatase [Nocardioides sp.]